MKKKNPNRPQIEDQPHAKKLVGYRNLSPKLLEKSLPTSTLQRITSSTFLIDTSKNFEPLDTPLLTLQKRLLQDLIVFTKVQESLFYW